MIKSEPLTYEDPDSGDVFEGVISWDDEVQTKRPGVMVSMLLAGNPSLMSTRQLNW